MPGPAVPSGILAPPLTSASVTSPTWLGISADECSPRSRNGICGCAAWTSRPRSTGMRSSPTPTVTPDAPGTLEVEIHDTKLRATTSSSPSVAGSNEDAKSDCDDVAG